MLYSAAFVSTAQQSESVYVHMYPLLFRFPFRLGHHRALTGFPVLSSRFSLVIYFMHSSVYMSISQFISPTPLLHLVSCLFSTSVSLFLLCKQVHHYQFSSLVDQAMKNLPTMQEFWVQSLGWEDPLEKGIPLQYSCLENSMEREPGGLQSAGSQGVGHD